MKPIIISLLVLFSFESQAQTPFGSSTLVQTCYNNQNCYYTRLKSFIYFDEGRSEMYVKIDFSDITNTGDSANAWIRSLAKKHLIFQAHLEASEFPPLSNYNANTIHLDGLVTFNGVSHKQPIEVVIYEVSENSYTSIKVNNNNYDKYRVDLTLQIAPLDYDLSSTLKETIFIGVSSGIFNITNAGSEVTHD
jgi:hypothetical protein